MLTEVLPGFCQRVSELESEKGIYIRVKVGKSRRRSDVIVSGVEVIDAGQLHDELLGRLMSLRPEDEERIYVEAMEKGSSHSIDCLHLKPRDLEEEEEDYAVIQDPMAAGFAALSGVVERLAVNADMRASQSHERLLSALTSILELQAIGIEAETRLELQEEKKSDSAMSEAAEVFGPLIPLVVERFSTKKVVEVAAAAASPEEAIEPILLKSVPDPSAIHADDLTNQLRSAELVDNAVDLSAEDQSTTI